MLKYVFQKQVTEILPISEYAVHLSQPHFVLRCLLIYIIIKMLAVTVVVGVAVLISSQNAPWDDF